MATNYRFPGDTITFTTGGAVASGDVVEIGSLVGIAAVAAAGSGALIEVSLTGVYEVPKTSAEAWTQGVAVYWTGTAATTTASGNTFMGHAFAVAANPSATGLVRLGAIA